MCSASLNHTSAIWYCQVLSRTAQAVNALGSTRGISSLSFFPHMLERTGKAVHKPNKQEGGKKVSDVFDRIKAIIVEQLGVDESKVTPDATFREDLEADSLDLVELIMAFEEEFGGEISDEEAQKISTVGEAVAYVGTHMVGAEG